MWDKIINLGYQFVDILNYDYLFYLLILIFFIIICIFNKDKVYMCLIFTPLVTKWLNFNPSLCMNSDEIIPIETPSLISISEHLEINTLRTFLMCHTFDYLNWDEFAQAWPSIALQLLPYFHTLGIDLEVYGSNLPLLVQLLDIKLSIQNSIPEPNFLFGIDISGNDIGTMINSTILILIGIGLIYIITKEIWTIIHPNLETQETSSLSTELLDNHKELFKLTESINTSVNPEDIIDNKNTYENIIGPLWDFIILDTCVYILPISLVIIIYYIYFKYIFYNKKN